MAKKRSNKNVKISGKKNYENIIFLCLLALTIFALGAVVFSLTKKDTQKQISTPNPTIAVSSPTPEVSTREKNEEVQLLDVLENTADKYITSQSSDRNTFSNENITFDYNPQLFDITYTRAARLKDRTYDYQDIKLISKDKSYELEIRLNMEGIGGACPGFPDGYELTPITLSEMPVEKAKYINSQQAHENWPLGNVYLVNKNEYGYGCPNVAGIHSGKNGATNIIYRLHSLYNNSGEYTKAEQNLDEIIKSIKGFW